MAHWLIELAILLGILGTSAIICFIADFIVSLYNRDPVILDKLETQIKEWLQHRCK